ncbi:hypothetical protein LQK60_004297 [Vibrio vulnificus]|nr:hypothetical protein [Vibrio vulnificus]
MKNYEDVELIKRLSQSISEHRSHNPEPFTVNLDKDEIREYTNRKVIRDSLLEDFRENIENIEGVEVHIHNQGLRIECSPVDKNKIPSSFSNLSSLETQNEKLTRK